MYNKRLVRVTDNVWIAGVCAGLADFWVSTGMLPALSGCCSRFLPQVSPG